MEEKEEKEEGTAELAAEGNDEAVSAEEENKNNNGGSAESEPAAAPDTSDSGENSATGSVHGSSVSDSVAATQPRPEFVSEHEHHDHGVIETIEEEIIHHPLYLGLSILFLLLLAIYGMVMFSKSNETMLQVTRNVSTINSQLSELTLGLQRIDATVKGSENTLTVLELKKILITLDELINRADGNTLSAATSTRQSIQSLIETMGSDSAPEKKAEPKLSLDISSGDRLHAEEPPVQEAEPEPIHELTLPVEPEPVFAVPGESEEFNLDPEPVHELTHELTLPQDLEPIYAIPGEEKDLKE